MLDIEKAIQDAVKEEVANAVLHAVSIAKKTIDAQVPYIIADLAGGIVKHIVAENRGAELLLHFKLEKE